MPELSCGCYFQFSHDHIIEFFDVCEKHQGHIKEIGEVAKEIVVKARGWYGVPKRRGESW